MKSRMLSSPQRGGSALRNAASAFSLAKSSQSSASFPSSGAAERILLWVRSQALAQRATAGLERLGGAFLGAGLDDDCAFLGMRTPEGEIRLRSLSYSATSSGLASSRFP